MVTTSNSATRGVFYVHSAPSRAVPARRVGRRAACSATRQPRLDPPAGAAGHLALRVLLAGKAGTASKLASALRGWQLLRFEVTAEPRAVDRGRSATAPRPDLGIFHAVTGIHGDIMIPEDRLRAAVARSARGETDLENEIDKLLGKPWDDELEPFRYAGEGAPVRWLHQVV